MTTYFEVPTASVSTTPGQICDSRSDRRLGRKEGVSLAARNEGWNFDHSCWRSSSRAVRAIRSVLPRTDLPNVVLQPADLAGSFEQFDEGRQASADQPEGARADATRFGRIDGWKSRYRRRGGVEIRGPLVIESRADLFKSSGGAEGRARRDRARAGSRAERSRSWGRSCGRLDNPGRLPSPTPNVRRFLAERERGRDHHS